MPDQTLMGSTGDQDAGISGPSSLREMVYGTPKHHSLGCALSLQGFPSHIRSPINPTTLTSAPYQCTRDVLVLVLVFFFDVWDCVSYLPDRFPWDEPGGRADTHCCGAPRCIKITIIGPLKDEIHRAVGLAVGRMDIWHGWSGWDWLYGLLSIWEDCLLVLHPRCCTSAVGIGYWILCLKKERRGGYILRIGWRIDVRHSWRAFLMMIRRRGGETTRNQ